jgi:NADH-quinone oxidoreductase subunit L
MMATGGMAEGGADRAVALFGLGVGLLVAGITAFYAIRMWLLAFWCTPRSAAAEHAQESPAVMVVPLWILVIPSIAIGWYLHAGERFEHSIVQPSALFERAESPALPWIASAVALAGIALAWTLYGKERNRDPILALPGHGFLVNLWGIEAFWRVVGARGSLLLGRMVALFDRRVIDGAVNGVGALCMRAGLSLRRSANGQAQSYALTMVVAIVLVVGLLIWAETATGIPKHIVLNPLHLLAGGAR